MAYHNVCNFTFQPEVLSAELIDAKFGFYIKPLNGAHHLSGNVSSIYITINAIKPPKYANAAHQIEFYLRRKITVSGSDAGYWEAFDLRPVALRWMTAKLAINGLQVIASWASGSEHTVVVNPTNRHDEPYVRDRLIYLYLALLHKHTILLYKSVFSDFFPEN